MDKKKLIWIGVYVVAAYFVYGYWKKNQAAQKSVSDTPAAKGGVDNTNVIKAMSDEEKTEFTNQLMSQYNNVGKTFTDGMILETKFGNWTKENGVLVKIK